MKTLRRIAAFARRCRAWPALLLLSLGAILLLPAAARPAVTGGAAAPAGGRTIVSLTFDDGRATQYTARSILASHAMDATFYVNSPLLGSSSFYMTWQQVQDLYSDGNEIAGHDAYHANLTQVSSTEAQRQICYDRVNMLNHGLQPTDFAYPYGAYNSGVEALVQACGYDSARTTDVPTSAAVSVPPSDPYTIPSVDGSGSGALTRLENAVTNAEQNGGGWVPVVFHDICSGCSAVATTQADFTAFLDWLQQQSASGVVVQTVHQVVGGAVQPAVPGPPIPDPPNVSSTLRNASLEYDTNLDKGPDCFEFDDFGSNNFTWARTTTAHTGSSAERLDVTNYVSGDNKLDMLQDLGTCTPTVTPGHQYRLSEWYISNTPVSFTVFSRLNDWSFPYWTSSPYFPASSTWTQATWVTPLIPSNVNGLSFGLTLDTNGSLTVDDFGITDVSATGSPDTTPPTVSLTAPTAGATVSGPVTLSAAASDNLAIDRLDFLVDGSVVGSAVSGPTSYSWNSRSVPNGNHTIAVRAVDTVGNTATTSAITVFVSNQATNLLQNPSLETASGSSPTCWTLGGYGTNTFAWTPTTDAHSGGFAESVAISSYTNGDRKLVNSQDSGACAPAVTVGHTYTVTAWYKGTAAPYVFAYYRNSSGSWVYWAQSARLAASASWKQAVWTTPAVPSGATNVSVGLGIDAVGSLTMDDFSFVDNAPPPDTTPPSTTILCGSGDNDASEGTCATWFNAPVQISLRATDNPGGSGVASIRFTTDGSNPTATTGNVYAGPFTTTTTVKYRAFDNAGNAEPVQTQSIAIDAQPPTSSISCNGAACSSTYSRTAVSVTLSSTDGSGSGVRAIYYTTDGSYPSSSNGNLYLGSFSLTASATVKYRAYDNAGNAEPGNAQVVQIDTIAPTSSISCGGGGCVGGFYNAPVLVSLAAADTGGSGVASIVYTTDGTIPTLNNGSVYLVPVLVGATTTVMYRAFDAAGNAEPVNSQLIRIDTTAPTSTISCGGSSCGSGFYNAPVLVSLSAVDTGGSGVASIRYTTDGSDPTLSNGVTYTGTFLLASSATMNYRAFDNAGNAESVNSQLIQIDTVAPTSAISCGGGSCVNAFDNAPVLVSLSAVDTGGSGVASIVYTTDGTTPTLGNGSVYVDPVLLGSTTTVMYRAVDAAGNAEPVNSQLIRIDTTAPTSTISCNGAACSSSPYASAVSVGLSATDDLGGSGVASIVYTTDGSDPSLTNGTIYTGKFALASSATVKYRAYDNAGNAEAINAQTLAVNLDAPTLTLTSPADGATVSGVVTLSASATGMGGDHVVFLVDGVAVGTDSTAPFSVSWDSTSVANGSHSVVAQAFDAGGNEVEASPVTISVDNSAPSDTTPPTSSIACGGTACSGGYYTAAVSVTLSATDDAGGSGVTAIRYTTDGTTPTLTNGTVYGGAFSVGVTSTVKYRAWDNAGNVEPVNSQLIQIDSAPPHSTIACNASTCGGLYSSAVSVTLSSSDGPGGSGVASIRYTTDGTTPTLTNGTVYGGAFSVGVTSTLKYRAWDNAGNVEPVNSQPIQIDSVPPQTAIACTGAPCASGYYSSSVSVTLSSSDGPGGSGVASIRYTTDGTTPTLTNGTVYGGAFSVNVTATVKYRAWDNAGNVEPVNSQPIQIDSVPPQTAIACTGAPCASGYYSSSVSVTLSSSDGPGGSGVASIRYTTDGTTPTLTNGTVYGGAFSVNVTATVKYRAWDNAGNVEPLNSQLIQIDSVPPQSAIACTGASCASGYYASVVSVTLSATDNSGGSGVASIRYTTDGSDPSLTNSTTYAGAFSVSSTTTVKYRAYDVAGNVEPVNSALIRADTTPPSTTIACNASACGTGLYMVGVAITLQASDADSGVASIRYTTDGTDPTLTNGTVYAGSFSLSSTTTVKYRAWDNVGNAEPVHSQSIQVDGVAPTVSLTSPTAGALLAGTVPLTAAASDNVAVGRVDFLLDGNVIGSATSSPYTVSWNSQAVPDGTHNIAARAVDTAGNTATTSAIAVSVTNTNLLQNPSLETASGSSPTCWTLGGYGTNTFAWTPTTDAHSGGFAESVAISSYTNGDRKLVNSQDSGACAPAVTVGHTYTVTAWYKGTAAPYVFAYYRNSSGSWVYWAQSARLAASASWKQAVWTTPAVPSGATNVSVGLGIDAVGSLTMDDFGLFAAG